MSKKIVSYFISLLLLLAASFPLQAQPPAGIPVPGSAADSLTRVDILHGDRYTFRRVDTPLAELDMIAGNVRIKQDRTLFYCDSAVINRTLNTVESFGRVHINDADTVNTYSNYMKYYAGKRLAVLKKDVRITDGKGTLYTQELEYDMVAKMGIYRNGGRVVTGKSVLTSKEGYYFQDSKEVFFKRDVILKDPKYTVSADTLVYNTETQLARFVSPTIIRDSSGRTIYTSEGYYDMKNGIAQFGGNPVIQDGAVRISGDKIASDDKSGISQVQGHAVYIDTAQGMSIIANQFFTNRKTGAFLATQKPLMIIKQDKDSIYISADTLFSAKLTSLNYNRDSILLKDTIKGVTVIKAGEDTSKSNRYFEAFHNVRIFSDSLQAVGDSVFYSFKDSIFRLFQNPVVWGNENQITGDTIYLYTKSKKPERLHVHENAMIINKVSNAYYNQISGNDLKGYFKEGDLDYMRVKGNAESIYYIADDDSAYIGVNQAAGDAIDIFFEEGKLNRVVFVKDVKGTTYPIRQKSPEEMRLRNFKWQETRRPKTKFELFD
jgi:lipopolysaccharide export system protein LptA